jgi:hypothetical protein
MADRPFVLLGRDVVEGGVKLIFRCADCGEESPLVILDSDPLDGRYPVACPCGAEANLFFGSPKMGRALIRSIKNTPSAPDEYHECRSPLLN